MLRPVLLQAAGLGLRQKPAARWKVGGASVRRGSANDAVDALGRHAVLLGAAVQQRGTMWGTRSALTQLMLSHRLSSLSLVKRAGRTSEAISA